MSFKIKKRIVVGLLCFMLAWPFAHYALHTRYEFDAWLFFGWAMYTGPKPLVKVTLVGVESDRRYALGLAGELKDAHERYEHRRRQYGRLASPDGLAALALRQHPELDRIGVRIAVGRINHRSGRIAVSRETRVYERSDTAARRVQ